MVEVKVGINMEKIHMAVTEYQEGQRTLFLCGSFYDFQGFTLFPVKNEELDLGLYQNEGTISRRVSAEEARGMLDNPYLSNKEVITVFLTEIGC